MHEPALCEIFGEILGIDAVGPDDSFLDLGGNSLLIARLINRIRAKLGAELEFADVFRAPSPGALAGLIAGKRDKPRRPLRPTARPARLPVASPQRVIWREYRRHGDRPDLHLSHVTRISGELDVPALDAALADLAARHETLRTVCTEEGGRLWQQILDDRPAHLSLTESTEDDLPQALTAAVERPFDLAGCRPFRAILFRLDPFESVLLLVMHRIAVDDQSVGLLVRDLAAAYAARRQGAVPDWKPLHVQYADYAIWQEDDLGAADDPGSRRHRQLSYWQWRLAGAPMRPRLGSGELDTGSADDAGSVTFQLSADVGRRLASLAHANQATLFMVLHAAIAAILTQHGAGTDIAVGTVTARRPTDGIADMVGNFAGNLALRADTSGDPGFAELLRRIRDADIAAYDNQDVSFHEAPGGGAMPAVRVLMADSSRPVLQLAGVRTRPEPAVVGRPADAGLVFTFTTGRG